MVGDQGVLLSVTGAGVIEALGAVRLLNPEPAVAPIAPVSAPVAMFPPLIAEPVAPVAAPIRAFDTVDGTPADCNAELAFEPNAANPELTAVFSNTAVGSPPAAIVFVADKSADASGVLNPNDVKLSKEAPVKPPVKAPVSAPVNTFWPVRAAFAPPKVPPVKAPVCAEPKSEDNVGAEAEANDPKPNPAAASVPVTPAAVVAAPPNIPPEAPTPPEVKPAEAPIAAGSNPILVASVVAANSGAK